VITTVCLDTDLLVAIQRNLPGAREAAEELEMILGDFVKVKKDNINGTVEMLRNVNLLPLDLEACIESGKIAANLRSMGEGLEARDALIAGIVKRHGEILVTRNLKHFSRVDGLKVKKW
jgi:tRNA(fMet)-specific endonuclease VapC